jgi:hypothetical protein
LVDETKDCNNMCKVVLDVPSGEEGHDEDGPIRKLALGLLANLKETCKVK